MSTLSVGEFAYLLCDGCIALSPYVLVLLLTSKLVRFVWDGVLGRRYF